MLLFLLDQKICCFHKKNLTIASSDLPTTLKQYIYTQFDTLEHYSLYIQSKQILKSNMTSSELTVFYHQTSQTVYPDRWCEGVAAVEEHLILFLPVTEILVLYLTISV